MSRRHLDGTALCCTRCTPQSDPRQRFGSPLPPLPTSRNTACASASTNALYPSWRFPNRRATPRLFFFKHKQVFTLRFYWSRPINFASWCVMQKSESAIGIDLGTTFCCVTVFQNKQVRELHISRSYHTGLCNPRTGGQENHAVMVQSQRERALV